MTNFRDVVAIVSCLKVLSQPFRGWSEKNHQNPSQDSLLPEEDFSSEISQLEAITLTTMP
jgi:hypothetical protein